MRGAHGNFIGGERRPAESGADFEVFAASPPNAPSSRSERPSSLGAWPRSTAADVAAAFAAARAARGAWAALPASVRREILAAAVRELAQDPDPKGRFAARLGLEAAEAAPHHAGLAENLERALREPLEPFASPRIATAELVLLAPSWSQLLAPTGALLFGALGLGRTVVVLSDPRAPMLADALADALARAGLPPGVVAVLHGDGDDPLRAAIATREFDYTFVSAPPARARRLRRLAGGSAVAEFGVGVEPRADAVLDLHVLRNKSVLVCSSDDPEERARAVTVGAFGRMASLSGQLPGQIARVICSERSFSRFTDRLIEALSTSPDVARPIPLVDRESEFHVRGARVLGLDEGATLIFDGESLAPSVGVPQRPVEPAPPAMSAAATTGSGACSSATTTPRTRNGSPNAEPSGSATSATSAGRSNGSLADAILAPTVFTNVVERMRLSRLARPAPILCLLRVDDDERAQALAARLDHGATTEDLSLDATE